MAKRNKEDWGSRFLYAEDLLIDAEYKTTEVEIAEYIAPGTLEAEDGTKIMKPGIRFKGKDKILILCKTNASIIHFVTGHSWRDGAKWVGEKVTIQARFVDSFGYTVPAIRVIPPEGTRIRKSLLQRLGDKAEFVRLR